VLTIGVIGGVVIASLAGARATQNSYAAPMACSNPSTMNAFLGAPISTPGLSRLVGVRLVEEALCSFNAFPFSRSGAPSLPMPPVQGDVVPIASLGGEYLSQDRVSVIAGHVVDQRRADVFIASALFERLTGWHVGQRIPMGFYPNAPTTSPQFRSAVPPTISRDEQLIGTIVFNAAVVELVWNPTSSASRWRPAISALSTNH
jgi:hypothetical protein